MKKIICEVCGESKFIKDGDDYVCQNCGMKYTLDQIKKMSIDTDDEKNDSAESDQKESVKTLPTERVTKEQNIPATENMSKAKEMNSKMLLIVGVLVAIGIIGAFASTGLYGEDKETYDLVSAHQSEFYDPSSVQLLSAYYFKDKKDGNAVVWTEVSAKNKLGGRISSCYYIDSDTMIDSSSCEEYGTNVNIDKINKKLKKNYDFSD